ncbi:ASCH domain-containing protein [Maricaulis maris]|uniref:ASCH domain-containing protein n=1 Tax=Maricaulis maris TaxID=74318 RepID=UPI003B8E3CA7
MKALSIKQPWAWAILHAGKDIENRSWSTSHRGLIAVHAGLEIDKVALHAFREAGYPIPDELPTGCFLGTVRIVDVVGQSASEWFQGPLGFVLRDPVPFDKPIAGRGRLSLFTPSPQEILKIQIGANWAAFEMAEPERARP